MQKEWLSVVYNKVEENARLLPSLLNNSGRLTNSEEFQECYVSSATELLRKFGKYKGNRIQTCTHAAGSALAMYSVGSDIEDVRIHHDGNNFSGKVKFRQLPAIDGPMFWFREAIGVIGGYGAETFMGMEHACSVLPAKIIAVTYCSNLEKILHKERGYFFHRAIAYTHTVITANRHLFNLLEFKLYQAGSLSQEELQHAFKDARRIPLTLEDGQGATQ